MKMLMILWSGNWRNRDNSEHDRYKEGDTYESVLFTEARPNSDYRKRVEAKVKKHAMQKKVVERVSNTVKSMLQRSNPIQCNKCTRED